MMEMKYILWNRMHKKILRLIRNLIKSLFQDQALKRKMKEVGLIQGLANIFRKSNKIC